MEDTAATNSPQRQLNVEKFKEILTNVRQWARLGRLRRRIPRSARSMLKLWRRACFGLEGRATERSPRNFSNSFE